MEYLYIGFSCNKQHNKSIDDSIVQQQEQLAWTDQDEQTAFQNQECERQLNAIQAKECLDSMNSFCWSNYTQQDQKIHRQMVQNSHKAPSPWIQIKLCLGTGRAFPYYIRLFLIAQYLKSRHKKQQQQYLEFLLLGASPNAQPHEHYRFPIDRLYISTILQKQPIRSLVWIQSFIDLEFESTSSCAFQLKQVAMHLVKLLPYLPYSLSDLQGTPYDNSTGCDLADERYPKFVAYLCKASRYRARLTIGL